MFVVGLVNKLKSHVPFTSLGNILEDENSISVNFCSIKLIDSYNLDY